MALRKRKSVRERVAERARHRCEYCLCPESHSLSTFTIEHILPMGEGGPDEESNLAYSCNGCNSFKGVATQATDPLTVQDAPLYHPRREAWETHFAWSADALTLEGRSPSGRATISRLKLNRAGVVNLRRLLLSAGLHPG